MYSQIPQEHSIAGGECHVLDHVILTMMSDFAAHLPLQTSHVSVNLTITLQPQRTLLHLDQIRASNTREDEMGLRQTDR